MNLECHWGGNAIFGFTENGKFEQRTRRGRELIIWVYRGRAFQARENVCAKILKWEHIWHIEGTKKRPKVQEW
jgi:hypothetical protein